MNNRFFQFVVKKILAAGNTKFFFLTLFCLLSASLTLSAVPVILKYLAENIEKGGSPDLVLKIFAVFCAMTAISRIASELKFYLFAKWEYGVFAGALNTLYEKIIYNQPQFFKSFKPGSVCSMIFQSAQGIRIVAFNFILHILPIIIEFIIVGASIYAFLNGVIATTLILGLSVYIISMIYFNPALVRYQRVAREAQVEAEGSLTEIIRGWKDIQCYQSFNFVNQIFNQKTNQLTHSNVSFFKKRTLYGVIQSLLIASTIILANYFTLKQPTPLVVGGLIMLNGYIFQLLRPLEHFGLIYRNILSGYADFVAISPYLSYKDDFEKTSAIKSIDTIEFIDVACEPALKNINLKINKGDKIALIGASGTGKTTFLDLITKFRMPAQGQILINGIDSREIDEQDLRENIAYMIKESLLFPCDLNSNISLGRKNSKENQLLEKYKIKAEIKKLSNQNHLSAGEEQRILLSRALYQDKSLLLLDESFSSLNPDLSTDLIYNIIQEYAGSVIYVTHNLEHAKLFSKIVELKTKDNEKLVVNTEGSYKARLINGYVE